MSMGFSWLNLPNSNYLRILGKTILSNNYSSVLPINKYYKYKSIVVNINIHF